MNNCNCYNKCNCRNYGFTNFIGDAVMTVLTGGLWLIWIFVREMRN